MYLAYLREGLTHEVAEDRLSVEVYCDGAPARGDLHDGGLDGEHALVAREVLHAERSGHDDELEREDGLRELVVVGDDLREEPDEDVRVDVPPHK